MLLGTIIFALMNSFLKILSSHLTIQENLFYRGITMVFFILIIMLFKRKHSHKNHPHKKGGWVKLILRGTFGGISLLAMLYNVETIDLGTTVAFAQTTPIWMALLAFILLGEKITKHIALSVIIGFIGVLLISNPQTTNLGILNIICGIISGVFAALAMISIRALKGYFDDISIMLSFGVMTSIMGFGLMLFQARFSPLDWLDIFYIFMVGLSGTVGQYFITRAYFVAPAVIVSPIDYTRIAFSLLFGIALGDLFPNIFSIIGMLLICASGVIIAMPFIMHEIKRKKVKKC